MKPGTLAVFRGYGRALSFPDAMGYEIGDGDLILSADRDHTFRCAAGTWLALGRIKRVHTGQIADVEVLELAPGVTKTALGVEVVE
jgi:hypothetical protein